MSKFNEYKNNHTLEPGDKYIDELFSGEQLKSCLKEEIYTGYQYWDYISEKISRLYTNAKPQNDILSFYNKKRVFEIMFPNLDYPSTVLTKMALWDCVPTIVNNWDKYSFSYKLAVFNKYCVSAEVQKELLSNVISTLGVSERNLCMLRLYFAEGKTYTEVASWAGLSAESFRHWLTTLCRDLRHPSKNYFPINIHFLFSCFSEGHIVKGIPEYGVSKEDMENYFEKRYLYYDKSILKDIFPDEFNEFMATNDKKTD